MNSSIPFHVVRDVGEPLGLYFRPERNGHGEIQQLLADGRAGMLGVVFNPCYSSFQSDLRQELNQRKLEVVLDTGMMELATPNGCTEARKKLPWANQAPHAPSEFDPAKIQATAESIAVFAKKGEFTAVLAPTHFLQSGTSDPWFQIDRSLVVALRQALDAVEMKSTPIYYPLALPGKHLFEPRVRIRLRAALAGLPVTSLWLRIHPFGSDSSGNILRRLIQACRELHGMNLPIVAERTGLLGLALLSVGAVSGMESGIATGEKFDYQRLVRRLPEGKEPKQASRVFIASLGIYLDSKEAKQFFGLERTRHFGCRDTHCCRRGTDSMIESYRQHFLNTRMGQIDNLGHIPLDQRPSEFAEKTLHQAIDNLSRASSLSLLPAKMKDKFDRSRRRLEGWSKALKSLNQFGVPSYSPPVERRIQRFKATA